LLTGEASAASFFGFAGTGAVADEPGTFASITLLVGAAAKAGAAGGSCGVEGVAIRTIRVKIDNASTLAKGSA
jgi:hypothetical protein